MKTPRFCKDCSWAIHDIEDIQSWNLKCTNPLVLRKDRWALGTMPTKINQPSKVCTDEREKKSWFAACGMKGKLWNKV